MRERGSRLTGVCRAELPGVLNGHDGELLAIPADGQRHAHRHQLHPADAAPAMSVLRRGGRDAEWKKVSFQQ